MSPHNYRKIFNVQDEILEKNSKEGSPNKLRVENEKRNNANYSYDSPLLERIKEEEEVKAINVFKQNSLGHSQSLKRMESPPLKSKTLRLDLFSNNIGVILVVLTKKIINSRKILQET